MQPTATYCNLRIVFIRSFFRSWFINLIDIQRQAEISWPLTNYNDLQPFDPASSQYVIYRGLSHAGDCSPRSRIIGDRASCVAGPVCGMIYRQRYRMLRLCVSFDSCSRANSSVTTLTCVNSLCYILISLGSRPTVSLCFVQCPSSYFCKDIRRRRFCNLRV